MTQFYSRVDTILNGDVYNIPFSYLRKEEIKVYINTELFTDWYFLTDSQIKFNSIPTIIDSAPVVSIRRETDIDEKVVDYENNSLLNKENLNASQDQLLYAVQEVYDNNEQFAIDISNVIQENQEEILDIQAEFEEELNRKFEIVADASEKINELDEAIERTTEAANTAVKQVERIEELTIPINENLDSVQTVSNRINDVTNIADNLDDILNKTVEVGQTITGEEGTFVKVENVGTKYAPVLDFTIPRGDKGDDGGMGATYDEETQAISFFSSTGTMLYPRWGDVQGDINTQTDLQALLNIKANMADVPVKTSQLQNDSKYITQAEMLQAIASIPQFKMSIVNSLPSIGEKMTLYLVPKSGTGNDVYNEYVWVEQTNKFEFLGTTAVDLTNYATKTEVNNAIGDIGSLLDEINGEVI